jgi:hypothetical protein
VILQPHAWLIPVRELDSGSF